MDGPVRAAWSAGVHPVAGSDQRSSSRDEGTWSPIERLFSNAEYCENPVLYPEGRGHQWQPNLGVLDGELWVLWNHGGSVHDFRRPPGTVLHGLSPRSPDLRGLYFSRLKRSDGKWINRRLKWDARTWLTVVGTRWNMATTQNLCRLRSGRVLAPVTLYAMRSRAGGSPRASQSRDREVRWAKRTSMKRGS